MSTETAAPSASPTGDSSTTTEPSAPTEQRSAAPSTPPSPETKKEPSAAAAEAIAKRLFKVKIDGEERDVEEDELLRGYQLRQASDKRFKEASEKYKEIEGFISLLKTDPRKVLEHPEVGHNARELAEKILAEELENELMDPKDKELRTLKQQLADRDRKDKEAQEAARKAQEAQQIETYRAQYETEISDAIKTSGLPNNQGIVNRVRDYMLAALENGYEASAKDVMSYVKQDYLADVKALFSAGDAQVIAELLGDEGIKKVREFDVKRLKDPKASKPVEQAPVKPERTAEPRGVKVDDYFEQLKSRFKD